MTLVTCAAALHLLLAITNGPNRSSEAYSGVWIQHGVSHMIPTSTVNNSFLVGGDVSATWDQIEPVQGQWNWTALDAELAAQAEAGFLIVLQFTAGPESPGWIYDAGGVERVAVKNSVHGWSQYPSYLSEPYTKLWLSAVDTFAAHIQSLPPAITSKIVAAQQNFGSTGDFCPWHGQAVNASQDISAEQFAEWAVSLSPTLCKSYKSRGIGHLIWNADYDTLVQFYSKCPGSFAKAGMVSHGLQVNEEVLNYQSKGLHMCKLEGSGCRGESWPLFQAGFFNEAPLWNVYWHLLWQLTFGNDMPSLSWETLSNASYSPYYAWFNRHAPAVRPPATNWQGAFVALRDGLDANDTRRFPERSFGPAVSHNQQRMLAIAANFSARGARQEDPSSATKNPITSRDRKAMDDVGWGIWSTNYGTGRMVQLAPAETSVGWWRLGPKSQPYGRWARGFEHATGRDAMGFKLDRRLWGGLPLSGTTTSTGTGTGTSTDAAIDENTSPLSIALRVVWFDKGSGSFELRYAASSGCAVAFAATVGDTGRWVERTAVVSDARFDGKCGTHQVPALSPATRGLLAGADILLVSTANAKGGDNVSGSMVGGSGPAGTGTTGGAALDIDTAFHMVEAMAVPRR